MRVLIVEDEAVLRDTLKARLVDAGFTVDVAQDGEEGVFAGVSSGAIARVASRIAGELEEGNVVFVVADDGWKYLSSGIYTLPVEEIENLDSTVWW